jgi:hypothetical protein
MHRLTNRHTFCKSFDSYRKAISPTSQQFAGLCASFAQMVADDSQGRVAVAVSVANVNVVREPRVKV